MRDCPAEIPLVLVGPDETDLEVKMVFSMELGRSLERTSVLFEEPSQKKK